MGKIFIPPSMKVNSYGQTIVTKPPDDFSYLIGENINDIILFENGTEELLDQSRIILPKNFFIFVGTKDGEYQFKSYELNANRIVVTTYKDIIFSVDSIG